MLDGQNFEDLIQDDRNSINEESQNNDGGQYIQLEGFPEQYRFTFISKGAYGKVYKGINPLTQELFALKVIDFADERCQGIPAQVLREISALRELGDQNHPNLVRLYRVIPQLDKIYMVFEFCEGDLSNVIHRWRQLGSAANINNQIVKIYLKQILLGVFACHKNQILHRDLKPQNILIGQDNYLKLADFGLARAFSIPLRPFTQEVVTIWYRAPELLLGAIQYSTAVDMWSVGCIFFELCKFRPIFNGSDELQMINLIFKDLGTPNEQIWPGYEKLPVVQQVNLPQFQGESDLRIKYDISNDILDDEGYELLMAMLHYNPEKRIIASDALNHPFLQGV